MAVYSQVSWEYLHTVMLTATCGSLWTEKFPWRVQIDISYLQGIMWVKEEKRKKYFFTLFIYTAFGNTIYQLLVEIFWQTSGQSHKTPLINHVMLWLLTNTLWMMASLIYQEKYQYNKTRKKPLFKDKKKGLPKFFKANIHCVVRLILLTLKILKFLKVKTLSPLNFY